MKKENRLSDRTRSPEPDDLTRQTPPSKPKAEADEDSNKPRRTGPNPDRSAPHVPPHDE